MRRRKLWKPTEYVEMWMCFQENNHKVFKKRFGLTTGQASCIKARIKNAVEGETHYGKERLGKSLMIAGQIIRETDRIRPVEKELPIKTDHYDEITKVFDTFKENLARVMASMLKEGQEKEVRDAYKRGFNNGKMETQKEMIEDAKKYSIGDMFRRHVTGGV